MIADPPIVVEGVTQKRPAGGHTARLTLVWALLVLNVLSYSREHLVIPIPSRVGQLITQGSLPLALVLAITLNRRGRIRPNLFLTVFSILAVTSLMMSVRLVGFGTEFRAARLILFVAVLWLLTPWWGRYGMRLVSVHLRVLVAVTVVVAAGAVIAHGKAFQYSGRLGGAFWPVQPPGAAHYAAEVVGLVLILWLCGLASRRLVLMVVPMALAVLILSRTRTALLAMLVGLLVAAATLLTGTRRVRIALASFAVIAVVAGPVIAPATLSWLKRGQNTQGITTLTGRTDAWHLVVSQPRPESEKILGSGMSNDSVQGLPIDDSWLAIYQSQGMVGDVLVALMLLILIFALVVAPRAPTRAIAAFLTVYCLMSSLTETGLGSPSPYMLDLVVAAALVMPILAAGPAPASEVPS